MLSSKTEIHLQSTIQILSRMSCFGKYLFAIKQKVKLSGAPVLLMLLRPTWPPLDHYSLGGLRERYSAMEKFSFISMDMEVLKYSNGIDCFGIEMNIQGRFLF